jgi:hypothetical protein
MPIPEANNSYVVKFKDVDNDMNLTDVVINNDNISENLKKSFQIVVVNKDGKQTYSLDDLDLKPIALKK